MERHKINRETRASLFAVFQTYHGFSQDIEKSTKVAIKRKELCEDALEELNRKVKCIQPGKMIKIVYYEKDGYYELEGMVAKIDLEYTKSIQIVNKTIRLIDIIKIEGEGIDE